VCPWSKQVFFFQFWDTESLAIFFKRKEKLAKLICTRKKKFKKIPNFFFVRKLQNLSEKEDSYMNLKITFLHYLILFLWSHDIQVQLQVIKYFPWKERKIGQGEKNYNVLIHKNSNIICHMCFLLMTWIHR
jgi:hypothetical protein